MINLNIIHCVEAVMCELRIIFKGKVIMEDVVRIKVDGDSIKLFGMLGEEKTVSGRIKDVNLTKQEAIIEV
ncbi:MAG: CooT family nickel-binding protein [Candidatus Methanoperedenaceae archaeon]|nr:CooT family nickel-binding protein [Candidatus Methanoperedenaceae archaeon]